MPLVNEGEISNKWKQSTFNISDKQAINMIAGVLHVFKAWAQSMHLQYLRGSAAPEGEI